MSGAHEGHILTTYRSLRAGTIPLLLILVVAPMLETFRGPVCVLGSISAYFYTPARGAFVLALAGVGVCLIAYKGNDAVEDVLLNFAGFMAFLVALVPTTVDTTCVAKYGNVVADANMADAVRNNVLTLFLMSVLAISLYRLLPRLVAASKRRAGLEATPDLPSLEDDKKAVTLAGVIGVVAWGIVLGELALFGFWPDTFKDVAHGISAITMVVGVLAVMVANAWGFARATAGSETPPAKHWRNRYTVTAATTVALVVVAIVTLRASQYLILAIELIVIVGFVVFWFVQTRELWDYPTRVQKSQKVDQLMEKTSPQRQPEPGVTEQPSSPPPEAPSPAETPKSRGDVYQAL
jgi:hypothetical protein